AAWVSGRFERLNAAVGAYETYDDHLLGQKAFHAVSILVRAPEASAELERAVEYYRLALGGLPDELPEKSECMLRLGLVQKMRGDLKAYRKWVDQAIEREPRLREKLDRLERGDGRVASTAPDRQLLDYLRSRMAAIRL
ncbi:MAG: hypothetical protein CMJ97_09540, partial [Planctomycetes bacterium]|nr:hypothetical protein [Planctomycetota bacterium]